MAFRAAQTPLVVAREHCVRLVIRRPSQIHRGSGDVSVKSQEFQRLVPVGQRAITFRTNLQPLAFCDPDRWDQGRLQASPTGAMAFSLEPT